MLRYARYALVVVFALLAVGVVALWVRSHYQLDAVISPRVRSYTSAVVSSWGSLGFHLTSKNQVDYKPESWTYETRKATPPIVVPYEYGYAGAYGFEIIRLRELMTLKFPHWFLAASSLSLAALLAFKRRWRFSLRSVLVATTILAALFGLAVYLV